MNREIDELTARAIAAGPVPSLTLDEAARQWLAMEAARRVIAAYAEGSPACAIAAQQVTTAFLEPGAAKRRAYELGGAIDSMRPYSTGLPPEIEELLLLLVMYLRDPARQEIAAHKAAFRLAHDLDDDGPLVEALWVTAWPTLARRIVADLGSLPQGKYAPTQDAYAAYAEAVRAAVAAGVSQREAARHLEISQNTVARMLGR